ncbi:hypothetical protein C8N25_14321 [Algoriphagus antarcticus]|uniref:Uncharacterized protein n=1 Tax=Algoriphagus antarcticus TaxID=238540 RepID=A0A3E0D6G5_9BACT|nr:hypothetical protein C8N25_14321 [Algoriphagus antarcticus]
MRNTTLQKVPTGRHFCNPGLYSLEEESSKYYPTAQRNSDEVNYPARRMYTYHLKKIIRNLNSFHLNFSQTNRIRKRYFPGTLRIKRKINKHF